MKILLITILLPCFLAVIRYIFKFSWSVEVTTKHVCLNTLLFNINIMITILPMEGIHANHIKVCTYSNWKQKGEYKATRVNIKAIKDNQSCVGRIFLRRVSLSGKIVPRSHIFRVWKPIFPINEKPWSFIIINKFCCPQRKWIGTKKQSIVKNR